MDHGSMDMGDNRFSVRNKALAQDYWYIVAGVLALLLLVRLVNYADYWLRLRKTQANSLRYPSRPTTWYWQSWATLNAICREISYPQIYVANRWLSWMTPPPLGRVLLLLIYWAVIIYMMADEAIVKDYYYWERIGFRNAWVTVTQLPLLYLLASKTSVIAFISGTSYERLNWLHRWVARTMFVTATVHGFHFWVYWSRTGILDDYLTWMPMVKWGLGAWGILLWMVLTSFKPLRTMAYEVFVIQHIIAAVLFLWVVYVHVPVSARYNVWFAVASICFDRAFRLGLLLWQNIKAKPNPSRCKGGQRFGHQTQITAIGESMTVLTIKDVHFKWQAGQHLYLWLPRVGPFEAHPYTIASAHQMPETCICNSIQLVIRAHGGFSKRLNTYARKVRGGEKDKHTLTAFVAGPYGRPPRWDVFETLVLISASTGASYTLPILESVLSSTATICTNRIDFLLAARQGEEIGFYIDRLHEALAKAADRGIELTVHIAVTGNGQLEAIERAISSSHSALLPKEGKGRGETIEMAAREKRTDVEAAASGCCVPRKRLSDSSSDFHIHHSATRPDILGYIRDAVEATGGETGVVVCGGASLVARVRTSVARISDDRAVHKGTGAQGIHLHVEEYCF